jgi:hypothetical protein
MASITFPVTDSPDTALAEFRVLVNITGMTVEKGIAGVTESGEKLCCAKPGCAKQAEAASKNIPATIIDLFMVCSLKSVRKIADARVVNQFSDVA